MATGSSIWARAFAVTTIGKLVARPSLASVQDQVARFTHTCFMITPYEATSPVAETAQPAHARQQEKRSALFNSGSEAVENAIKMRQDIHAQVRGRGVRHTRTTAVRILTMALIRESYDRPLQARLRPVRHPRSTARRCHIRSATPNMARSSPPTASWLPSEPFDVIEKQVGADNLAAVIIEPIQGEGGFHRARRRFPCPRCWTGARKNNVVFIADEGADRVRPSPERCSPANTKASNPT